ncbi:hypothetical protein MTO96_032832 [Rhipicephalus appendiculatus]
MLQAFLGSGRYFHEDGFKNYSWWSLFTATNYEANKQCMEFLLKGKIIFTFSSRYAKVRVEEALIRGPMEMNAAFRGSVLNEGLLLALTKQG